MGDVEKTLRSLDATILVRNTAEIEAKASTDALEGTSLEHFQVVRLLGRGGMGAVYYGNDLSLEQPVAIKVLAPEIAPASTTDSRFRNMLKSQGFMDALVQGRVGLDRWPETSGSRENSATSTGPWANEIGHFRAFLK